MEVGRLGEPSLPWGFAGRCRAGGRAESGGSGCDAAGVAGAALRVADDPSRFAFKARAFTVLGQVMPRKKMGDSRKVLGRHQVCLLLI